jgi:hypothetical protein
MAHTTFWIKRLKSFSAYGPVVEKNTEQRTSFMNFYNFAITLSSSTAPITIAGKRNFWPIKKLGI